MENILNLIGNFIKAAISWCCGLFWGDLITIPLQGGGSIGLSLMVLILVPSGIYFTIRTKFLLFRYFPEMIRITLEKKKSKDKQSLSGFQALLVSTATRVGTGNLVGVVAAVSAGGAGAVFWMWVLAVLSASTAFIEAVLAQSYKEKDPLYGGYRGGPAYYLHHLFLNSQSAKKRSFAAAAFALAGLVCWGGVSQVLGNSVSSALDTAFQIPPIWSTVILVAISAVIVLRKNATVKVLDIIVPVMAVIYFAITVVIIVLNMPQIPNVVVRIVEEAFGIRQVAAGGLGAVIMNGAKRGLFSNEAGSGSAPCAAAAADVDHPAKAGLLQAFGVFIDTIVICTCTALLILLVPESITGGLKEMPLLLAAMGHHLGQFGVIFITVVLWLFCISTFLGILFYARSNVAYVFGDNWKSQTAYKIFALIMLFIGGLATYTFVWELADVGIGLMTVINMIALFPLSRQALQTLADYKEFKKYQ